jgi:hypothetical protein
MTTHDYDPERRPYRGSVAVSAVGIPATAHAWWATWKRLISPISRLKSSPVWCAATRWARGCLPIRSCGSKNGCSRWVPATTISRKPNGYCEIRP